MKTTKVRSKRILSLVLALMLLFTCAPSAFAFTAGGWYRVEGVIPDGASSYNFGSSTNPSWQPGAQAGSRLSVTRSTASDIYVQAENGQSVFVTKSGDHTWVFTMPASDINVTAMSKTTPTVNSSFTADGKAVADGDSIAEGKVISAWMTVHTGTAPVNSGSLLMTFPDHSTQTVAVSGGKASFSWTVPSYQTAQKYLYGGSLVFTYQYLGSEYNAASTVAHTSFSLQSVSLNPSATTIQSSPDALTAMKATTLSLSGVQNTAGVATTDYTVTWFQKMADDAQWKSLASTSVTPAAKGQLYMATITGTGVYEGQSFSVTLGCDATMPTTTTLAVLGDSAIEGQNVLLEADVNYNGNTAVASGTVTFFRDGITLGTAAVINGKAQLESAMPVFKGQTVAFTAVYNGDAVFTTSTATATNIAVVEAKLPATWTIQAEDAAGNVISAANANSKIMVPNTTYTLSLTYNNGLIYGRDFDVEWQVSVNGSNWSHVGNGATVQVTPEDPTYRYHAVITPSGAYQFPANGFASDELSCNNNRFATMLTLNASNTTPYEAVEEVTLTARATYVSNGETLPVPYGIVKFYRQNNAGVGELLSEQALDITGVATYSFAAPEYYVEDSVRRTYTYYAVYVQNDVYAAATVTPYGDPQSANVVLTPHSTAIKWGNMRAVTVEKPGDKANTWTALGTGETLVAGQQYRLTIPGVTALDGTTALTVGKDYYVLWQYQVNDDWVNLATVLDSNSFIATASEEQYNYRALVMPTGNPQLSNYYKAAAYTAAGIVPNQYDVALVTDPTDTTTRAPAVVSVIIDVDEIYEGNPVTITAVVVPENNNAQYPSGSVSFEYSLDGDKWMPVMNDDSTDILGYVNLEPVTGSDEDGATVKLMRASIVTSNLPVSEDNTYSDVRIRVTYHGDKTFGQAVGYIDPVDEEDAPAGDTIRVYSSTIYTNATVENRATLIAEPVAPDKHDMENGIVAYVSGDRFASDKGSVRVYLSPVTTWDYDQLYVDSKIYTLVSTDYTVQWQINRHWNKLDSTWEDLAGKTGTDVALEPEEGCAYRAKVTPAANQQRVTMSALENEVYYSNILFANDAETRLTVNAKPASSGAVDGDDVTFDAYVMGGETAPNGNITVTVKNQGGETVYTDEELTVNSGASFTWKKAPAGIYTVTVSGTMNDGYVVETQTFTYVVRYQNLALSVNNKTVTYDSQTQHMTAGDVASFTDFAKNDGTVADYTDLRAMALSSLVFSYQDVSGNAVEPTKAGVYTVSAYLPQTQYWVAQQWDNVATLTIEKRQVSVSDIVVEAKAYDKTTAAYVQEITLANAVTDQNVFGTGLPTDDLGMIAGDSLYAVGVVTTASANAGATTANLTSATLMGDDAVNYELVKPESSEVYYSEPFTIQRNQLQGDIADLTIAYTGANQQLKADDIYVIDQQGNQMAAADYTVTYYYHNGETVQQVSGLNKLGMYTVVVTGDANYKGGVSQNIYVADSAVSATPSKDFHSATIALTNTAELYGANNGVVATATDGKPCTIAYYVDGAFGNELPTEAGRYLVRATAATGDVAYGLYTVTVANQPQVLPQVTDKVYNGTAAQVENVEAFPKDTYFTYVGGNIVGFTYNAPSDAGTYTVTAHIPGEAGKFASENYSASFTITKAEVTVTTRNLYAQWFMANPIMLTDFDGIVNDDSTLKDLVAYPTITLGSVNGQQFDLNQVGNYPISADKADARNYTFLYQNTGKLSVINEDPESALAITGYPQGVAGAVTVFYGDKFQLNLYGNKAESYVNNSSLITWTSSDENVATVNAITGEVTATGVGPVTITATRGKGANKISTSLTFTVAKKEVSISIAAQDWVYNGQSQSIPQASFVVNGLVGADARTYADLSVLNNARTKVGSQMVFAMIQDADPLYRSEAYCGRLTVNFRDVNVYANNQTVVYGNTLTYAPEKWSETNIVAGEKALTDANTVSIRDDYARLDVGAYEILLAGRENSNYNVTYVTPSADVAGKVTVTSKSIIYKTGTLNNIGLTSGAALPNANTSVDGNGNYPMNGVPVDGNVLNSMTARMYGEPNYAMNFVDETLVAGDSVADLSLVSKLVWIQNVLNQSVNIASDANVAFNKTQIVTDAYLSGKSAYTINGNFAGQNYNIELNPGYQNVYQRPVTLVMDSKAALYQDGALKIPVGYTTEQIKAYITTLLTVDTYQGKGGLASLLNHTIKDLDLQFSFTPDTFNGMMTNTTGVSVTVTVGNQNYWSEALIINLVPSMQYAKVVVSNETATSFTAVTYVRNYNENTNSWSEVKQALNGTLNYAIYTKRADDDYSTATPVRTGTLVSSTGAGDYYASYSALAKGEYQVIITADGYSFTLSK